MDYKEFKDFFIKELNENKLEVYSDEIIKKFYNYMVAILEWNEKINLTAIKEPKEFIVKHFIDSLTISRLVADKKRIIDIGTGAGFPGVPLKIVNEELDVTLVDSVNKKLNVIKDAATKSNITGLNIVHSRIEDLANQQEYREKFDVVTSRALANMSTLVEYTIPFLKIGGVAICMKGPNFKDELDDAKNAIRILGGELVSIESLNVGEEYERNIIIIKKVKNTPKAYPRANGKPLKEPIK